MANESLKHNLGIQTKLDRINACWKLVQEVQQSKMPKKKGRRTPQSAAGIVKTPDARQSIELIATAQSLGALSPRQALDNVHLQHLGSVGSGTMEISESSAVQLLPAGQFNSFLHPPAGAHLFPSKPEMAAISRDCPVIGTLLTSQA